jgi:hypothetical protein
MLQEWGNVRRWRVRLSGEARQFRAIRSSVEIRNRTHKLQSVRQCDTQIEFGEMRDQSGSRRR